MVEFSIWIFATVFSFNCFANSELTVSAKTPILESSEKKPFVFKLITSKLTMLTEDGLRLLKNMIPTLIGNQAISEVCFGKS